MIVLSQEDSVTFGEQSAPIGIYKPIEILGNLWVLPDESESIVTGLELAYTKRNINQNEWIIPTE